MDSTDTKSCAGKQVSQVPPDNQIELIEKIFQCEFCSWTLKNVGSKYLNFHISKKQQQQCAAQCRQQIPGMQNEGHIMVLNNGNAPLYDQPSALLKVVQVQDLCPVNQQLGLWKPYRAIYPYGKVT